MVEDEKTEQVQGDCPECGKNRWANVLGEKTTKWEDEVNPIWTSDTYRLLECAGCKAIYYEHVSYFSEDIDYGPTGKQEFVPNKVYYPSLSKRERPSWIWQISRESDHELGELFLSLYTALDQDLVVLAASGVRTVFESAVIRLGVDPALSFEEKINQLKAQGRIGNNEREDLAVMVDASSAAMHRGWKPSLEEIDTMMTTLERFMHHSFLLKDKAAKLKDRVPAKPRRKGQAKSK